MSKNFNFAMSAERVGIEGYGIFNLCLSPYTMETNQSNVSGRT